MTIATPSMKSKDTNNLSRHHVTLGSLGVCPDGAIVTAVTCVQKSREDGLNFHALADIKVCPNHICSQVTADTDFVSA